jgi:hypothetical protein
MNKLLNPVWLVAALFLVGCVNTVTQNQPGTAAYRDRVETRQQKPLEPVFEASKRALNSFGNITAEGKVFVGTNQVRIIEGSINGRAVYMRVEEIDPQLTAVVVQVRTKMGGTDLQIAKDVVRRIATELE